MTAPNKKIWNAPKIWNFGAPTWWAGHCGFQISGFGMSTGIMQISQNPKKSKTLLVPSISDKDAQLLLVCLCAGTPYYQKSHSLIILTNQKMFWIQQKVVNKTTRSVYVLCSPFLQIQYPAPERYVCVSTHELGKKFTSVLGSKILVVFSPF